MKISPCPFCGAAATAHYGEHVFNDVQIRCDACAASGPLWDRYDGQEPRSEAAKARAENLEDATKHWNSRVSS